VKEIPQSQLHCWINAEGVASQNPELIGVFYRSTLGIKNISISTLKGLRASSTPSGLMLTPLFPGVGRKKHGQPRAL
jgi:hypothetical protein